MDLRKIIVAATFSMLAVLTGCGGSSSGPVAGPPPPLPPPPPPPPPAAMSAAGLWNGQAVTPAVADIASGFEFNDADGFTLGTAPFTADFAGGITESRGIGPLYADGLFSWHVDTAGGTIMFPVAGDSIVFSTRTVTAGDNATIQILDDAGVEISSTVVPDAFQQITVSRDTGAGESLIGSVVITVNTGEIVIDAFTFSFEDTASTDDIGCLFAPNDEFVCIVSDTTSGDVTAAANGTFAVAGSDVSGSGTLYAAPGETLADGSIIAPVTISAGTIAEGATLDLTVDSTGLAITLTTTFDDTFDRGADLATVEAMYTTNEVNGEATSFAIDAAGAITGQTASGCVLSGQVTVIDAAANAYDVALDADNATCGALAGAYAGLGISQDEAATDDLFVFAVAVDGQMAIVGEAIK